MWFVALCVWFVAIEPAHKPNMHKSRGLKNERIVLKSDQEPAMVDVLKEIQKSRECDYGSSLDNSRVGDSDSNGTIENAIGSFEGVARTLRIALEEADYFSPRRQIIFRLQIVRKSTPHFVPRRQIIFRVENKSFSASKSFASLHRIFRLEDRLFFA